MKTFLLILALACLAQPQEKPQASPDVTHHIRQLIQILAPGSPMRTLLEEGVRGEGVRYPWMDEMKRHGIKRALVQVDFAWHGQATDIKGNRILYFDKYDTDCSQIINPAQLKEIQASGVGQQLQKFVTQATTGRPWYYLDKKPPAKRGVSSMEVYDDEWLPALAPSFTALPITEPQLLNAVSLDDEDGTASILASGKITKSELDSTLMTAALTKDDSCIIRPLLQAGADPNHRNQYGLTALMYAAGAGNVHDVKVLLEAGADRNALSALGETALSLAQKKGHTEVAKLLDQSRN